MWVHVRYCFKLNLLNFQKNKTLKSTKNPYKNRINSLGLTEYLFYYFSIDYFSDYSNIEKQVLYYYMYKYLKTLRVISI